MSESVENRLSLEALQKTPEYLRLTPKQRLFVATYCEGGLQHERYDAVNAAMTAYKCKSLETARVLSYALRANIHIVAVLALHFNRTPTEEFLITLDRAIANKNISRAQVELLKLKFAALGIENRLPTRERELEVAVKDAKVEEKRRRKAGRPPKDKELAASDDYAKIAARF